jgi:hypothetical protein
VGGFQKQNKFYNLFLKMISLNINDEVKTSMKKIMENEALRCLFSDVEIETNFIRFPKELAENQHVRNMLQKKFNLTLPPPHITS